MSKAMVVIMALAAAPALADQSPSPAPSARFGAQRPQSDPYKTLFAPRTKLVQPAIENKVSQARPKVVCGMTLIPGGSSIDPKMALPRPSNGIDYKLRTIDPPICSPK